MHRLIGIDRRDRQQEIEAAGDPVELAIGFHRRCKDGAAPKRAVMARRPVLPVGSEAARRAEQRVARRQRQIAKHLRIEGAARRPVDRRQSERKMRDRRVAVDQRLHRWLEIRPRAMLDVARTKIDRDLGHGLAKRRGGARRGSIVARPDQRDERRQARRVFGLLGRRRLIVERHQKDAVVPGAHGRDNRLQRGGGGMIVLWSPDQIGRTGGGDMPRNAIFGLVGAVQHEEEDRAIDMRPAMRADQLTKRTALAEFGGERHGGQSEARAAAHAIRSRAVSAVKAMKRRIASSSAGSGSPLHSSMKNFLNSSAIAQPWSG